MVWAAVCLVAIPLGVYVVSYLPVGAHREPPAVGRLPGRQHRARRWSTSPRQMYGYHNGLASAAPRVVAVVGLAVRPQAGVVLPGQLGRRARAPPSTTRATSSSGGSGIAGARVRGGHGVPPPQPRRSRSSRIGFAAQWVPWARIDRAAFQYHYYTALPFVILALAYLVAELWHGPSRRTWLAVRLAAAAGRHRPGRAVALLAAAVRVRRRQIAEPGLAGLPGGHPRLRPDPPHGRAARRRRRRRAGAVGARSDGFHARHATSRSVRSACRTRSLVAADRRRRRPGPRGRVASCPRRRSSPGAASRSSRSPCSWCCRWCTWPARSSRPATPGGSWSGSWSPSVAGSWSSTRTSRALPLPSTIVNAYQGLLPTYLYAFQFPVSTASATVPTPLLSPTLDPADAGHRRDLPGGRLLGLGLAARAGRIEGQRGPGQGGSAGRRLGGSPGDGADGLARTGGGA